MVPELVAAIEAVDALARWTPWRPGRRRHGTRQVWAADDARTGAAWLAARTHMPLPSARRCLRLGRSLRHLPLVEDAWGAGEIDSAHVAAFARARNDRTAELLARDEEELLGSAWSLFFSHFQRVLDYWLQHADPDGPEVQAKRQVEYRRLDISRTFQGTVVGNFAYDPIRGTIVKETVEQIERELFEADWAEAKQRLGRDPLVTELARTPKQRRFFAGATHRVPHEFGAPMRTGACRRLYGPRRRGAHQGRPAR